MVSSNPYQGPRAGPDGKRWDEDEGTRLTDCCGACSTYVEGVLSCKACYEAVPPGQGDGSELRPEQGAGKRS